MAVKSRQVKMMERLWDIAEFKHWEENGRHKTVVFAWDKTKERDGLVGYVADTDVENIEEIGPTEFEDLLIEPFAAELVERKFDPSQIVRAENYGDKDVKELAKNAEGDNQ